MAPPILVLAGPTGVGKTALALDVAEALSTDILSADSRQVYRGLDIGTAKPSLAERARVPHRWVDELHISEPTSAGRFGRVADAHIETCRAEARTPFVVGGSTLYIDAVVQGLATLPEVGASVQRAVDEEAATASGRRALYEELSRADPEGASTLDPTKSQRLARLVGLLRATGQSPSGLWKEHAPRPREVRLVVLDRPRGSLYRRIEARIDAMLADGLIDENRRLRDAGHRLDAGPLRTIGYQEPMQFLSGEITEDEMVCRLRQNTRRYAKRQLTWFRRYPKALWVDADSSSRDDIIDLLQ